MVVRMRSTKGHTANRRSHHALKEARLSKCASCGAMHLRHTMCEACGMYRGRQVVDARAREEKKLARKQAKLKAIGEPRQKQEEERE